MFPCCRSSPWSSTAPCQQNLSARKGEVESCLENVHEPEKLTFAGTPDRPLCRGKGLKWTVQPAPEAQSPRAHESDHLQREWSGRLDSQSSISGGLRLLFSSEALQTCKCDLTFSRLARCLFAACVPESKCTCCSSVRGRGRKPQCTHEIWLDSSDSPSSIAMYHMLNEE